ncbi:AraC-type DNA-binding protein [Robiginitalea myxolifaciens]|uniref:AraC-type DNA-binding protein n=1 Tax=Robiginitalea myxolifaciens TaxID=400055 RepID=A0A1I6FNR8_9FLAO|nr:AraC family transcriptional regulator [Robiginitalea myxolifaciens]SFR31585.1 AraC-type DNA-binding protein [Robiginitalea myxolifaciens]
MQKVKPAFEAIAPDFGHSFTYQKFSSDRPNKDLIWHYHPEIELVYVNGGSGRRQIGSHISSYTDGDLILIGSNLPHCGFTDAYTGNRSESVVQMKPDFLGNQFLELPELRNIQNLFAKAKGGLAFGGASKKKIGEKIEILEYQSDFQRLLSILNILNELGSSKDVQILNADQLIVETQTKENDRINIIFNYVKSHYKESIALEDIADLVYMTVPSFCRYFKKATNKTFVQFVNEYRLVHASNLLAENQLAITEICYESGFNNISHFNKLFREFTGMKPSEYRNQLKTVMA